DPPRPRGVRGRAMQVRRALRPRRWHRQRPDPAPARARPVLALARGLRCVAVRARRPGVRRPGRADPGARRVAAPGPGSEVEVAGLERLVELDNDHRIIARAALERIAAEGVRRKLVGVRLGGEPLTMWLEDFWPVTTGGREVGGLTSAAYSPRLKINMGYAWLPVELTAYGTTVLAMSPDGPLAAEVVPLPFWDRAKE